MQSHPSWVRGLKLKYVGVTKAAWAVAPLVGAWIETKQANQTGHNKESHPSWVRGLKHTIMIDPKVVNESHPSWVRGLKLEYCGTSCLWVGRTPRGCVD